MTRHNFARRLLPLFLAAPLLAAPMVANSTPKHCPPGHAKKGRCKPSERYRLSDRKSDFRYVENFDRYGIARPRTGHVYIIIDEELFLINRATQEVIEGLGALSYLLSQ